MKLVEEYSTVGGMNLVSPPIIRVVHSTHVSVPTFMTTSNWDTVPVGQGRRKIILKIDVKILGKLLFF
jgi:hypothetical protein